VPTPVVTGVSLDSRRVRPGDLYAALPGSRAHGAEFAGSARDLGAVAVLTDPAGAARCAGVDLPLLVVPDPRRVLGALAARIYGEPSRDLRLVAVTGTQGKTTTTRLAESALQAAGVRAAVVGTIGTRIAGTDVATPLTTPEATDLHGLFAVMRESDVACCLVEVSSHALVMGRVDGVVFDVAAFTNLGRDHLDFHTDMEDYYSAKARLFTPERARLAMVNADDEHGRRLARETVLPVRTYAVASGAGTTGRSSADWLATDVVTAPERSDFTVRTAGEEFPAGVPLPGAFNVANALCAIAALGEAGFDARAVAAAMAGTGGVPGRLERVDAGQPFLAVVDYAHKPDAVAAVLEALRPRTSGRLIVVLGAGGDRDPGKRPLMGEVAARLADVLVVTDDNPRSEDPAAIRAAVVAGARGGTAEVHELGDRRAAIGFAARNARAGDTVVVAGKGHETGQEVAGTVHPFDDRDVLRSVLEEERP
jgi:UDP-N-acetylmuramoyl-L-alanyl-D-glutamate--2,6-diaminopimelate ligase